MASGKKNYFRHSTSAFEDPKIQKAIQLLGYEGYAFYFILLELMAKQCENEFKNPIEIHQQTVRIVLRKSQQSCHKVIRKLEESGLFLVTFKESLYEFHIPNLAKYMGKYKSKMSPNSPNKRKEKKRKEKEIKTKKTKEKQNVDVAKSEAERDNLQHNELNDLVVQAWNNTCAGKINFRPCPFLLGWKTLSRVREVYSYLQANKLSFEDYFSKLASSDFLKIKKGAPITLLWALNQENLDKVCNGLFDNQEDPLLLYFKGQGVVGLTSGEI